MYWYIDVFVRIELNSFGPYLCPKKYIQVHTTKTYFKNNKSVTVIKFHKPIHSMMLYLHAVCTAAAVYWGCVKSLPISSFSLYFSKICSASSFITVQLSWTHSSDIVSGLSKSRTFSIICRLFKYADFFKADSFVAASCTIYERGI